MSLSPSWRRLGPVWLGWGWVWMSEPSRWQLGRWGLGLMGWHWARHCRCRRHVVVVGGCGWTDCSRGWWVATAADRRWGGAGSNQYEGSVIFGSGYKCFFKSLLFFGVGVKTPQLSNLQWMPNSVSMGFVTAMKTGTSRRFKRYATTCRWVSSQLPFTEDWDKPG